MSFQLQVAVVGHEGIQDLILVKPSSCVVVSSRLQ